MQAVLQESKTQFKHVLEWSLIGSLLAHALIMLYVPKPTYEKPPVKKQEIQIELVKETPPAAVSPPAEPEPTPPTPEPPKPEPVKPPPKPVEPKPAEQKPTLPQKASPLPEPPAEPTRPVTEAPAPSIIAAKPTASESKAEVVVPPPAPPAPPPEPPKATGPSEGDIEAARNAFRNAAHKELQKNQRYPRIAQDRGIEGDVKLSINIDDHGNITGAEVLESSGNKPIDEAALAAARKSQLKPHFNEILRGKISNIVVTVSFKLSS